MPPKIKLPSDNHIIKMHTVDGIPCANIAKHFGVNFRRIRRVLGGKYIPKVNYRFSDSEQKIIIETYLEGVGTSGIPSATGIDCTRANIVHFLKSKSIKLRSRSEQQQMRMNNATPEQRLKWATPSHNASRGRKKSFEVKCNVAKGVEGAINKLSKYERIVESCFIENGIDFIASKAVGIYNLDFGIVDTIAVEVFGGGWSISSKDRVDRYIKRTKNIGEVGYHHIFFMCMNDTFVNTSKLIETINILRGLPSSPSQYRMIWGDFDGATGFCSDIDHHAFVYPFKHVINPINGRYGSVPR